MDLIELTRLRAILAAIGLPVLGVVGHHLWSRFRQRLVTVRWAYSTQPMAFATDDVGWGQVQILYEGQPTKNLHMIYVELQNASARDLSSMLLTFASNPGSLILRSSGQTRGSLHQFQFSSAQQAVIHSASERLLTPAELSQWSGRSEFLIPVLNRAAIADFKFLVARLDYATPTLVCSGDHLGTRIVHQPLEQSTLGVRNGLAQRIGVLASFASTATAVAWRLPNWLVGTIALISGLIAILLGAVLVRIWRLVLSLADG